MVEIFSKENLSNSKIIEFYVDEIDKTNEIKNKGKTVVSKAQNEIYKSLIEKGNNSDDIINDSKTELQCTNSISNLKSSYIDIGVANMSCKKVNNTLIIANILHLGLLYGINVRMVLELKEKKLIEIQI